MSTALDSNANVHAGEFVLAEDEQGLLQLDAKNLGLEMLERTSVHLDQTATLLRVRHGCGGLLERER